MPYTTLALAPSILVSPWTLALVVAEASAPDMPLKVSDGGAYEDLRCGWVDDDGRVVYGSAEAPGLLG